MNIKNTFIVNKYKYFSNSFKNLNIIFDKINIYFYNNCYFSFKNFI